jgi:hypothetical protein
LNFGVIAIVIALAFSGNIYALPSGFTQVAASDWEAELRPSLLPKDVDVVVFGRAHYSCPAANRLLWSGVGELGIRF